MNLISSCLPIRRLLLCAAKTAAGESEISSNLKTKQKKSTNFKTHFLIMLIYDTIHVHKESVEHLGYQKTAVHSSNLGSFGVSAVLPKTGTQIHTYKIIIIISVHNNAGFRLKLHSF